MKNFLLATICALFLSISGFSQTIVGTDPENKNVVLEEFTGLNCVFCPEGHLIAQQILNDNPNDVVLVNVHVGAFATPNPGQPDYRTPWGSALDAQANVAGYPAGTVNRHIFPGWGQQGGTAMSRNYWTNASNIMLAEPSYLNVGATATIVTSTRQLVVDVEVYYTGDSPLSSNFLTVALMQNNIIGFQSGGGANYNHMHMLRHFLTGQWGAEITETTEGSLYTASFYYEIPEDYINVECVLEDLEIAAYVAEGQQEIISGSYANITYLESLQLDAGLVDYNVPQTSCGSELSASVTIKNFGIQELTSLDFEYFVNDEEPQSYTWNGSLNQGETEVVELPVFEIDANQSNTFNLMLMNPNSNADELPANNSMEVAFEKTAYLPQNCQVAILTDGNPEETSWDIKNSAGDIIASGGPYSVTSIILEPFEWPENGCFVFTIYDAGGNGLDGGFYKIVKQNTQVIWEGDADFQYEASAEFAYDELIGIPEKNLENTIRVYPNPIHTSAKIDFVAEKSSKVNIDICNILGKNVRNIYSGNISAGNQSFPLELKDLENGIYFVRINMDGKEFMQKIHLIHQ